MRRFSGAVVLLALSLMAPGPVRGVGPERQPATILIDADSGRSLRETDADSARPTGLLGELMLLLLSFEQSALGLLPLQVPVTVGEAAVTSAVGGFRVPLQANKAYLLSDLLKAVTVTSAGDAAVAVAEAIAGSVPACVELMNARAQRLGMTGTRYASVGNVNGGATAATELTTARDVARLAQVLLHHASVLQWASVNGVPFDQGSVLLRNTNQLLGAVPGVDGLQASAVHVGHGASYSVVATAQRGALRLVAVVLDAPDTATRYSAAADLLEWGFAHYERIEVVREGESVNLPVRVQRGTIPQLMPVAARPLSLLRQRGDECDLQLRYQLPAVVSAPLKRQQVIGEVIVEEKGHLIAVIPMLSPTNVAAGGVLSANLP